MLIALLHKSFARGVIEGSWRCQYVVEIFAIQSVFFLFSKYDRRMNRMKTSWFVMCPRS